MADRTDGEAARMLAYHSDPSIKSDILAQLARHRAADELVQGYGYWTDGKGCAVGCTLYSGDHMEFETRFGIPVMIARLEDCIFEGLPVETARAWPERLMSSIDPGADLSRVGWQFLHWLITDEAINPGISHPTVRDAVRRCADMIVPLTKGGTDDQSAAWSAAASATWSAARSARSAASAARSAESAAWSAESAESAALSAESAALSAESAARSAASAASAAESAASAASAAWSAESAESAARSAESAAYVKMADRLIELIEAVARKEGGA